MGVFPEDREQRGPRSESSRSGGAWGSEYTSGDVSNLPPASCPPKRTLPGSPAPSAGERSGTSHAGCFGLGSRGLREAPD